jgi:hypothetical protein
VLSLGSAQAAVVYRDRDSDIRATCVKQQHAVQAARLHSPRPRALQPLLKAPLSVSLLAVSLFSVSCSR